MAGIRKVRLALPLRCPKCGYLGKARLQRLNRVFRCRNCGQSFHVQANRVEEGAPVARTRLGEWTARHHPAAGDLIDRAAQFWCTLPRWLRLGLTSAGLVFALGWFSIRLIEGNRGEGSAGTLEGRAGALIAAVAAGERDVAHSLTLPSTGDALAEWMKHVERTLAPLSRPGSLPPRIEVVLKNAKAGIAVVKALIATDNRPAKELGLMPSGTAKAPSANKPKVSHATQVPSQRPTTHEVVTYWVRDPHGPWLFDAQRTLRETGSR